MRIMGFQGHGAGLDEHELTCRVAVTPFHGLKWTSFWLGEWCVLHVCGQTHHAQWVGVLKKYVSLEPNTNVVYIGMIYFVLSLQ